MSSLINQSLLDKKLKEYKTQITDNTKTFAKWRDDQRKEEEIRTLFFNDIFVNILGYKSKDSALNSDLKNYNLIEEKKTQKDGTKPDGILGYFSTEEEPNLVNARIVIELKDKTTTKLDTVEKQAFEYRDKIQNIEWVITSNTNEIRLYSAKSGGRLKYQSWTMSELANSLEKQKELHFFLGSGKLFVKDGISEIAKLIEDNTKEENEIKNKFYKEYKEKRVKLMDEIKALNSNIDAISKAQKLLDRMLFIRFCIDRGYITKTIINTIDNLIKLRFTFYQALKVLFETIDKGSNDDSLEVHERIIAWNGGLFAEDKELNDLQIGSEILKEIDKFFKSYNFSSQVDVHILGHIFEQSISDIEKLKEGNEFDAKQSKRKKDGVFYTPEYITQYIVEEAVGGWLSDRKNELNESELPTFEEEELKNKPTKATKEKAQKHFDFWKNYAEKLTSIKVLDPACGSGAFLVEVFNYLENEWQIVNEKINYFAKILGTGSLFEINHNYKDTLKNNIYGVDINFESVQITRLSLWIQTAHNKTALVSLDDNIKCGNSLIDDPAICPKAFKWEEEFPFKFDVVVGNPPYVKIYGSNPHNKYFKEHFELSNGCEVNLYKMFIEKAYKLLVENGNFGFITPSNYLTSKDSYFTRKLLIEKCKIIDIFEYPESDNVFENVTQAVATLICKKMQTDDVEFKYKTKITEAVLKYEDILKDEDLKIKSSNNLIGKIQKQQYKLSDFADGFQGEIHLTAKKQFFHKNKVENSLPMVRGNQIKRYSIFQQEEYCEIIADSRQHHKLQRIIFQEVSNNAIERRINAVISDEKICSNSTNYLLPKDGLNIYFLLAFFNSKLINYYFKQFNMTNHVAIGEIKTIPVPNISTEAQTPFITHAQKMLEKTKQLNELSAKFTKLLSADLGVAKTTRKLDKWYNLQADEFFAEASKQNKNLSLSQKSQWLDHFEEQKQKALTLQAKISQTDAEIDKMVYALYGLSEEEIGVVEGLVF